VKKLIFLLLTAVFLTGFVSAQDDGGAAEEFTLMEFTLVDVMSGNIAEYRDVKPDSVSISSSLFNELQAEKTLTVWDLNEKNYLRWVTVYNLILGKEVNGISRYSEPMIEII